MSAELIAAHILLKNMVIQFFVSIVLASILKKNWKDLVCKKLLTQNFVKMKTVVKNEQ